MEMLNSRAGSHQPGVSLAASVFNSAFHVKKCTLVCIDTAGKPVHFASMTPRGVEAYFFIKYVNVFAIIDFNFAAPPER